MQRLGAPGETQHELFVDCTLHEDTGAGAAVLPAIAKDGVDRGVNAAIHVGIGKDDVRRLAAKLKRDAGDIVRAQAHDLRANFGRAGKGDL